MAVKNAFGTFLLLILMLSLTSCAPVPAEYDYDHDYSFWGMHRYAWIDTPLTEGGLAANNNVVDRQIVREVNARLLAHGFEEVPADSADFLIAYHVGAKKRIFVDESGYYYREWGARFHDYRYHIGTLVLDVIDPESRRLVWRGWATEVVDLGPEGLSERLDKAVDKLLANFPPGEAL